MSDIAKKAGVSKNTVSLALRNDPQISEATKSSIKRIAEELEYQRNPVVAHLMAKLRSDSPSKPQASLALLNAHQAKDAFTNHPTIPTYVEGCRRRARLLGYGLDSFWLHDPELDGDRLHRILRARGIRGAVIVGLMNENRPPAGFLPIWENHPCVFTGVPTRKPALPSAGSDHHMIALRAFEQALEYGYQRPALVLDDAIDRLLERRFTAGYHVGQNKLPLSQRLKPFYQLAEAESNLNLFADWLNKERPDVIFTLYNKVHSWLTTLGHTIPKTMGLIQLEWRKERPDWAGMNQHNDLAGEAAIDMVISSIHSGEEGIPQFPRNTLIRGTWVPGKTIRKQPSGEEGI